MTAVYQRITINSGIGVRRETMGGREYLVAPVSMLVPGVLNGSKGPLLYLESEIVKNFRAWNLMPLTLDHPSDDKGQPVSARHPAILEKYGLGFVFNVTTAKGKLDGEAWFDIERADKLAPELIQRLESNQIIELSTGLVVDQKPVSNGGASYKGKPYVAIAHNYRPDHLAILLHKKGACSCEDGCGVLVNDDSGVGERIDGNSSHPFDVLTDNGCEDPSNCDCKKCKKKKKKSKDCPAMNSLAPCLVTNAKKGGGGANCGIGPGGFQNGNTCAGGGAGRKGKSASKSAAKGNTMSRVSASNALAKAVGGRAFSHPENKSVRQIQTKASMSNVMKAVVDMGFKKVKDKFAEGWGGTGFKNKKGVRIRVGRGMVQVSDK